VDGGFGLEAGALAPLSSSISLELFTRLPFGITEERVVAELSPGIRLIQGTNFTVVFELQFINYATGKTQDPKRIVINMADGTRIERRLEESQRRLTRKLNRKLRTSGTWNGISENDEAAQQQWIRENLQKRSFPAWFALLFDPASAQLSVFFRRNKVNLDVGDLSGLQLLATGEFFVARDTFSCLDLSTEFPQLYRGGEKLKLQNSECFEIGKCSKKLSCYFVYQQEHLSVLNKFNACFS